MEKNPWPNSPIDLKASRCGELARKNSDTSFSVTVGGRRRCLFQGVNVNQDESTQWTDEKHSAYLSFLEENFVEELHRSIRSRQRYSRNDRWGLDTINLPSSNMCNPPDQSEAMQDGSRQNIKFEEDEHLVDTADSNLSSESGRGSQQCFSRNLCHQSPSGSIAEVSDQNFVDDCENTVNF